MDNSGVGNRRVHMANERTFLAWIRTSIGILALGFVVEKASVFLKYISVMTGNQKIQDLPSHTYSAVFGILLMGFAVLIGLLSYIRYINVKQQIDKNSYKPSRLLDLLLTLVVVATGVVMIVYMTKTL